MMTEVSPPPSGPAQLAEWIARADELPSQRSIVLGSKCCTDLKSLASDIAAYLNQFDEHAGGHWAAFNHEDLRRMAGDPACRGLFTGHGLAAPAPDDTAPDIDRVARCLAELGGAVLGGQYGADATRELTNVFRVCLCCQHPVCLQPCHIWLNPGSFSPSSLVAVIADSFLDWCSRRPDTPGRIPTSDAQHPATGAEPDQGRCGSL